MLSSVVALLLLASPQAAEADDKDNADTPVQAEDRAEDAKICRYIREGMNSRRKKKVCLTKEQWQEANQGN